jgi:hypothetical protein
LVEANVLPNGSSYQYSSNVGEPQGNSSPEDETCTELAHATFWRADQD